jgi:tetratricopeptide (TPR) repeat protein
VTFYFCFREGRVGYDADAAAVYNPALKDDPDMASGLPPAAIFTPGGERALKFIPRSIHFEKDKFYASLRDALREHPKYDQPTPDEKNSIEDAAASPRDAAALFRAARFRDQAAGADARSRYEKTLAADPGGPWAAPARLRLAILDRYEKSWDKAEEHLAVVELMGKELADHVAMERAHRLLAAKKDAEALKLLDAAIRAHPRSTRLGELRFYAGAANWRLDRKDWANYHWWWVIENLPDDHHVIRCQVALTAPANCFANPELDGFAGSQEMTISQGVECRLNAKNDYEALKAKYEKQESPGDLRK